MNEYFGKITQVIGPVVDVTFEGEGNSVPEIYTALAVQRHDGTELMLEVEQHIGENTVRCVAMDSTDGLQRGTKVKNLGQPISVPTGDQVKDACSTSLVSPSTTLRTSRVATDVPFINQPPTSATCPSHKRFFSLVSK